MEMLEQISNKQKEVMNKILANQKEILKLLTDMNKLNENEIYKFTLLNREKSANLFQEINTISIESSKDHAISQLVATTIKSEAINKPLEALKKFAQSARDMMILLFEYQFILTENKDIKNDDFIVEVLNIKDREEILKVFNIITNKVKNSDNDYLIKLLDNSKLELEKNADKKTKLETIRLSIIHKNFIGDDGIMLTDLMRVIELAIDDNSTDYKKDFEKILLNMFTTDGLEYIRIMKIFEEASTFIGTENIENENIENENIENENIENENTKKKVKRKTI